MSPLKTVPLLCLGLLATTGSAAATAADVAAISRPPAATPLVAHLYTADPAAHVFEGKLYLYPSHDIDAGITDRTDGNHYAMRDYHVFSMDDVGGPVTDHGVALELAAVPWASRQLWAPDAAYANGIYHLFFPARDRDGLFRIGVATSRSPSGPFRARPEPIAGTYSIDPAVYEDDDGAFYLYFGGIQGGQLSQWPGNCHDSTASPPLADAPATAPRVARLRADLLELAEPAREILILDEAGVPLRAGDQARRFFEGCWVHKYRGTYYLTYSTGGTHLLCYATGSSPYGPFTYRGMLLKPVLGWTTHGSIVNHKGRWYLFYHDTRLSGRNNLRNVMVAELQYEADGSIRTVEPPGIDASPAATGPQPHQ